MRGGQARLNNHAGLFEVVPGIYQVRGMDISNVTFIAGETGWIVIDPLTAEETAATTRLPNPIKLRMPVSTIRESDGAR